MKVPEIQTGVWISTVNEDYSIYVHSVGLLVDNHINIKWEWLNRGHGNYRVDLLHPSILYDQWIPLNNQWPYSRPSFEISELELS